MRLQPGHRPARARTEARPLAELDLADRDRQDAALRAHPLRARLGVRGHGRRGALRPGAPATGASFGRGGRVGRDHGGARARGPARGGTPVDHARLRRDVGAPDVLGGRRRRVHGGDLRARRRVRPRRRTRASQRPRVRTGPEREALRDRRIRRVLPRARRLDHVPVDDAAPAHQRRHRDGAGDLGRPRPARGRRRIPRLSGEAARAGLAALRRPLDGAGDAVSDGDQP